MQKRGNGFGLQENLSPIQIGTPESLTRKTAKRTMPCSTINLKMGHGMTVNLIMAHLFANGTTAALGNFGLYQIKLLIVSLKTPHLKYLSGTM